MANSGNLVNATNGYINAYKHSPVPFPPPKAPVGSPSGFFLFLIASHLPHAFHRFSRKITPWSIRRGYPGVILRFASSLNHNTINFLA